MPSCCFVDSLYFWVLVRATWIPSSTRHCALFSTFGVQFTFIFLWLLFLNIQKIHCPYVLFRAKCKLPEKNKTITALRGLLFSICFTLNECITLNQALPLKPPDSFFFYKTGLPTSPFVIQWKNFLFPLSFSKQDKESNSQEHSQPE